jgi:acetylornithine deacetylase/succinyl-diaminopimelate desuccinylase-like protein
MTSITQVLAHIESDKPSALARMMEVLTIPSISTDPKYKAQMPIAAAWFGNLAAEAGLIPDIHPTDGHPILMAVTPESSVPKGAPRILFYGHYDVQPPDPINLWTTPAFEPTIRDGKVYARGAADDKGQVCTFLEALLAWKKTTGSVPIHVTLLLEGEEECGSANLPRFLEKHKAILSKHDVVLISDTSMWNPTTLSITYGLRGLAYFDIQLQGPARDLHSGVYGGTLANPANILTRILGRLQDDNNKVTIPGFYDDVAPLKPEERQAWEKLNFSESEFLAEVGVNQPHGEAGFSTLERRWTRPSCDINGLWSGYQGPGAKTVLPAIAGAKVSFRLAAHQSQARINELFEKWLRAQNTFGCTWKITPLHGAQPVLVNTNAPAFDAARRACEKAIGKPPVLVREGATLPIIADFQKTLGLDSLMVGFGLNDDCLHSPNEKFNIACFQLGCRTHALIIDELSKLR